MHHTRTRKATNYTMAKLSHTHNSDKYRRPRFIGRERKTKAYKEYTVVIAVSYQYFLCHNQAQKSNFFTHPCVDSNGFCHSAPVDVLGTAVLGHLDISLVWLTVQSCLTSLFHKRVKGGGNSPKGEEGRVGIFA